MYPGWENFEVGKNFFMTSASSSGWGRNYGYYSAQASTASTSITYDKTTGKVTCNNGNGNRNWDDGTNNWQSSTSVTGSFVLVYTE